MAYADSLQRTWRENILFSALVELTYRCNLDCFFCYNDRGLKGTSLDREQYFHFFEDLRDLGTLNLTLTGGEPLAHPDFFALGRRARELGFVIRVKSNGHALNGRLARRLKEEVDPFIVEISLHGARSATHDRQTRVPGSFAKLLANLRELRALAVRVKLNSPLTAWNEPEIEEMFKLADELGLPIQFDPQLSPRDDGDLTPLAVTPSPAGVAKLFQLQKQRAAVAQTAQQEVTGGTVKWAEAKTGTPVNKHCGAGSATLAVDPYGNIYPCVQWRRPVGNLHHTSVREIWLRSPALARVRQLTVQVKEMMDEHGPDARNHSAFCPGAAEQQTGNPLKLYPAAELNLRIHGDPVSEASAGIPTS